MSFNDDLRDAIIKCRAYTPELLSAQTYMRMSTYYAAKIIMNKEEPDACMSVFSSIDLAIFAIDAMQDMIGKTFDTFTPSPFIFAVQYLDEYGSGTLPENPRDNMFIASLVNYRNGFYQIAWELNQSSSGFPK